MEENEVKQAEAPKEETVEVTLVHSSFGTHTFRCYEGDMSSEVPAQIAFAKRKASVMSQVADLDKRQNAMSDEIRACHRRIELATELGEDARVESEKESIAALESQSGSLSVKRKALLDTLE